MSNLRIRVAYALGKKLVEKAEGGMAAALPAWATIPAEEQNILLELADTALVAIASEDNDGMSVISDADLRHVLDMHRDAADIVWGVNGYVNGLSFTEDVVISDPVVSRSFCAGETYWRVDAVPLPVNAAA